MKMYYCLCCKINYQYIDYLNHLRSNGFINISNYFDNFIDDYDKLSTFKDLYIFLQYYNHDILDWLKINWIGKDKQESLLRLFSYLGLIDKLSNFKLTKGNYNLQTIYPIETIREIFYNSNNQLIKLKDKGDSSDLTGFHINDPKHILTCTSKNMSNITVDNLDIYKLLVNYFQYDKCNYKMTLCITIRDVKDYEFMIKNIEYTNREVKKYLDDSVIIVEWSDLKKAFLKFKQKYQNIRFENLINEEKLKKLNNKKLVVENEKVNINKIQTQDNQRKEVKYIDLFCGLGAFHTAFNRNNIFQNKVKYTCVFACDINEGIRYIYEENYGLKPEGDINKINIETIPNFDILCAGFPCQPFSIAGNQKGFKDETQGNLFFKILEIVDKKQPSILMLENVKNLHTIHKGKTFKIIINELEIRGYNVSYKVIDSRYYNSPQSRQRIYIICNKDKKYTFREINKPIVPVLSIIDNTISDYFDFTSKYKLEKCSGKNMMKYKLINRITKKGGRQGERVYDITKCGPTICASSGGPGAKTGLYYFDGKIRTLSINETLKMFGFDHLYKYESLTNKKDMLFYLGNSIVVNVLEELIKDL